MDLLREIIEIFQEECPSWLTAIHDAIAEGKPKAVQEAAHCLKGTVGTFGATSAASLAQQLETMGRDQNLTGADEIARQLEQAVNELIPALEDLA